MKINDCIPELLAEKETTFLWLTTSPNPRSRDTGFDAGQRGWRLHAVEATDAETDDVLKRRASLCGLGPRHGWGLDLFINDECSRCKSAMIRREKAGETFIDLGELRKKRYEAAQNAKAAAWEAAADNEESRPPANQLESTNFQ